jgi:hypothetical protein
MTIEKVTYQKTYSIGPYLTDRVGFEATPNGKPSDDPSEMLTMLEEIADAWHKKAHPHLYQESKTDSLPLEARGMNYVPIISKDKEKIEIAIDNAETIEDLNKVKEFYEFLPASLISHYNKRIQELSSGRPGNFTDGLT